MGVVYVPGAVQEKSEPMPSIWLTSPHQSGAALGGGECS